MMKFSNLHLNQNLIRGIKFQPQIICSCGCNKPMTMRVEGGESHKVISNLMGAYYEETQCEHVIGFLRTIDKEVRIIIFDKETEGFKLYGAGKQTPKQLGKTIEGFIKNTIVHYVILAEEVEEGGVVIISNKKEVFVD